MASTQWSPEMALGNVAIDAAHKDLFKQMLTLLSGLDSQLDEGLPLLVDKLERDFREEEDLMEGADSADIRSHREEHARVLGALHHIAPDNHAAAREALELMALWFPAHLMTQDKALAAALEPGAPEHPPAG